jgi:4-amino-4-deoxy-L-arabinose transferase-like glycosyltransferase
LASELGANRRAQIIASSCAAAASVVLVVGHLLSTTTFDLLAWAALCWLLARIINAGDERLWVAAGLVAGLALLNKPLLAFLAAALCAGLLLAGPRHVLRSPWLWAGVAVAAALWSPWLLWQGAHGWPLLDVSSAIASGESGSSQPRWALLPFQFLLVSPVLAPVWIAGLVVLAADRTLRRYRVFAIAWGLLVLAYLAAGGKPYYLAGLFPVLLAAGSIPTERWVRAGSRGRQRWLAAAIAVSALVSAVIALPVLPASESGPVVAINSDVGETIGWPDLVRDVARAYHATPGHPVIFTANYGEAGAIDRYGRALGLPRAFSGHNALAWWGPPPANAAPVITVGLDARALQLFTGCQLVTRIDNTAGIDNDERGEPIERCLRPRAPWLRLWPHLRHLG